MDENAVLGRVDPQVYGLPAVSIGKVMEQKPVKEIDDKTVILADVSQKAIKQSNANLKKMLKTGGYDEKTIQKIIDKLASGDFTHDSPVTYQEARKMGLRVNNKIPKEVHRLMEFYPQDQRQQPAVQFIPKSDGDKKTSKSLFEF